MNRRKFNSLLVGSALIPCISIPKPTYEPFMRQLVDELIEKCGIERARLGIFKVFCDHSLRNRDGYYCILRHRNPLKYPSNYVATNAIDIEKSYLSIEERLKICSSIEEYFKECIA